VALWGSRFGKENGETALANCVLRMKIFLFHPKKLDIGDEIYSICSYRGLYKNIPRSELWCFKKI
jgi:hypothetical protein